MKIFFIINSLFSRSGSERVACILANKLVENFNYEITIINRDTDFNKVAYPLNNKIRVEKISGSYYYFYKGLSNYIKEEQPDRIIIHNMGKLSLLCAFIPNIKKIIVLEHVSFISRPKWVQMLSELIYKKIDMVITLTNKDKYYFDKINKNVITIPNFSPYPVSTKQNVTDKNKVIAVGRLTDQKNFLHLLKAWEKVFLKIPNWKLCIYGEGEQQNLLNEYIQSKNLENIFLEDVTAEIKTVYEESSFFVMSSKYEGLPMVLIEAQSFGLPVVSYNCPNGPSDVIIDGYNGFLIENQNIDQLAEKILELSADPSLLTVFSKNSLKNALNYQPEKILELWINKVLEG